MSQTLLSRVLLLMERAADDISLVLGRLPAMIDSGGAMNPVVSLYFRRVHQKPCALHAPRYGYDYRPQSCIAHVVRCKDAQSWVSVRRATIGQVGSHFG